MLTIYKTWKLHKKLFSTRKWKQLLSTKNLGVTLTVIKSFTKQYDIVCVIWRYKGCLHQKIHHHAFVFILWSSSLILLSSFLGSSTISKSSGFGGWFLVEQKISTQDENFAMIPHQVGRTRVLDFYWLVSCREYKHEISVYVSASSCTGHLVFNNPDQRLQDTSEPTHKTGCVKALENSLGQKINAN